MSSHVVCCRMSRVLRCCVRAVLALIALSGSAFCAVADDDNVVSFHRQIQPILRAKCTGCHQPAKPQGDYVMTAFDQLVAGGESEQAAVVPGKPDESPLVAMVTPENGQAEMPKNGEPLSESQITLIRRWIAQGAKNDSPATTHSFSKDQPPVYDRPPVVTAVDYAPNGTLLAVAGFSEILLHDTAKLTGGAKTASLVGRLIGTSTRIESLQFSPDGTRLAAAAGSPGTAGELQIWDVAQRQLLHSIPVTFDTIYGVSWSPDSKQVAFGCADSTVRAVDAETGKQVLYQGSHNDWVFDTVYSVDGTHLVSVGRDMTAKLIEVKTQRFVDNITSITPKALKGGISSVVRHPKRDEILFGGADGVPKIYQMHRTTPRKIGDDANLLWELPALPGRVFAVDFSSNAETIVAGSSLNGTGAVHIYGIDPEYKAPAPVKAILQKPTHTRSGDERKTLKEYFSDGIKTHAKLMLPGGVYAVSIHPENAQVAVAGADGAVRVLRCADGTELANFIPVPLAETTTASRDVAAQLGTLGQAAVASEQLPDELAADVVGILVQPAEIQIDTAGGYVQTIVMAEMSDGQQVDVTRHCRLRVDGTVGDVQPTGLFRATADGTGELVASFGEHTSIGFVTVTGAGTVPTPDYVRDVMPVISKLGCNAGTCHGSKDGKNGFKLSLRGYDPIYDIRAWTDDAQSRRVNLASPDDSLLLLKCTSTVPHEGGQLTTPDTQYYKTLRAWIAAGAKLDLDSPRVVGIKVSPQNPVVQRAGARQQVRVVAEYADGTRRDVTREAFIESGNTDVVTTVKGASGLLEVSRRGEAPVLVRYEGSYAATTITVMGQRDNFRWQQPPQNNPIDGFVAAKLKRTKTLPSPLCSDYEFIRRVHLDLTGLPPAAEKVRKFVADQRDSRWKRDELIDQLIGSEAFVEHWTNKWADLLQVNRKFLGAEGAKLFRNWIRQQVADDVPYDQFVRSILTAEGSNKDHPAASYYKILRTPTDLMENTTHLFLATRFNCNKCHDHPFERWTQDQYFELAAYFAQVGLEKDKQAGDKRIGQTAVESGKPLYEVVVDKKQGELTHDRTGQVVAPQVPFAAGDANQQAADVSTSQAPSTRRQALAEWVTSPENPYFARSYVNRLWGYLTGTGIIEPIDDIRAGNPPTNPQLLDYLTRRFVAQQFNAREIIREICKSRTYQLSVASNRWNVDDGINFSHAKARRLPAEVLYDTIQAVTGTKSKFPGVEAGTRAAALPDVGIKSPDGFLGNLGRPARESACECERSNDLQLGPVMALVSGPTVGQALGGGENALADLVQEFSDDRQLFDELFIRVLNRPASAAELNMAMETLETIELEHGQLTARLAEAERAWKPQEAELEAKRWSKVAAAERALTDYLQQTRERREQAVSEREAKIQTAETALAKYESQLPNHIAKWESADQQATTWTPLNFDEAKASFGAKLTPEKDGSLFASGKNGRGNYELTADVFDPLITGVRIEALTDKRLPKQGPGRADDGNFVLSEFKLQWADPTQMPEKELHKWTFDDGENDWQPNGQAKLNAANGVLHVTSSGADPTLTRQVEAEGKAFLLELVAKVPNEMQSQLFWGTKPKPGFDEARSVKLTLGGKGNWLRYRYYFHSDQPLAALRLDPTTKAGQLQIREIRLVRIEEPKYKTAKLVDAQADFSQKGYSVTTAVDGKNGDNNNGWAVSPQGGKPHQAIFALHEPIRQQLGSRLKLTLMQNYRGNKFSLGRFRISYTTSESYLDFGLPEDIRATLAVAKEERSSEQAEKLTDYFRKWDRPLRKLNQSLKLAKQPLPVDPKRKRLEAAVAEAKRPIDIDPKLVRLRQYVKSSETQLKNRRLTAAQDVTWALINTPAFLFNH